MIPGKIVRFLEQHANMAFAGIRDRTLTPCGTRVSSWKVHPDGQTMTVCFPPPLADRVIDALEENGHLALTLEEHPTHETYQLKGRYLRHRPVEAEDLALVARLRERLARTYQRHIPDGIDMSWAMAIVVPDPDVAVDVEIHEVYLQTPGPGAGGRLYPPVEPEAVVEGATVRAR